MHRFFHSFPVFSLLLGGLLSAQPSAVETAPGSSGLRHYLDQTVAHDAVIATARLRWEATAARTPAAGTLPDPELAYGYFISPIETRVGAQNQKFGLFQKIPWPGRLRGQRAVAEAGVDAAYLEYLDTVRRRLFQAKSAWIRLASLDQQLDILKRQLTLIDDALASLDAAFTAGRGELADTLLMRQQRTQVEARHLSLRGERSAAEEEVRRFAGSGEDGLTPSLADILTRPLPDPSGLAQALLARSELLKVREADITLAERAHEVARLEGRPDLTLGFEYTEVNDNLFASPPDNGEDAIMASIRISLPIWRGKYDALERGARRDLAAARERERATRDDLVQRMRQVHARAKALAGQVRLYETRFLPQTQETFEAAVAGFASGRLDPLRWIEAQRDLLDAETGLVLLRADHLQAVNKLERLCAIELIAEHPANNNTGS